MLFNHFVYVALFFLFFVLMKLLPPKSTRTYPRFPYTTLFRSQAQPRLGQPAGLARIVALEDRACFGVDDYRHAQRLGHGVNGDIVMRGPNPAGGKEIVI